MKYKYTITFIVEEEISLEDLRERCGDDEIDNESADDNAHDFIVDNWGEVIGDGELPDDVKVERVK